MTEILGWTQANLKIAKNSSPKIYHKTMSQKLQITQDKNKIGFQIWPICRREFFWILKAFLIFWKMLTFAFCNYAILTLKLLKIRKKLSKNFSKVRLSISCFLEGFYSKKSWYQYFIQLVTCILGIRSEH